MLALATQAGGVDAIEVLQADRQEFTPAPAQLGSVASGAQSCAQVNDSVPGLVPPVSPVGVVPASPVGLVMPPAPRALHAASATAMTSRLQ
jgi:hypothetical protein